MGSRWPWGLGSEW